MNEWEGEREEGRREERIGEEMGGKERRVLAIISIFSQIKDLHLGYHILKSCYQNNIIKIMLKMIEI